jgi:hypothetical protein
MKLPAIELDEITTLPKALNVIEQLLHTQRLLIEELNQMKEEIARLKDQPKKPTFSSSGKQSASVTNLLKENRSWHKSSKKGNIPVDRDEKLPEVDSCICGSTLFTTIRTTKKVVQGIVFRRDNVSYSGRVKQCRNCGKRYRSILPSHLKGISFSPDLASFLSFWHYACRVTMPLLLRTMDGIGIQISSGQVSGLLLQNGDNLQPADHQLRTAGITKSSYLQSDASGAKRKDKKTGKICNQYVQVISNKLLSIFSITKYYNAKTLNRLLGKNGRKKPFVSDDGSPNGECLACKHKQLCWVHEIRHYKKLFPFFNRHQVLQQKILTQWKGFYHLAKHYAESPPDIREEKKQEIQLLFDQITSQITGYDLLDKQLRLTKKKKERLLLFLDHPELPIHNNQCEHDIRPFVIIRKISGGTKSYRGDKSLARHLSVIQTAQKQGLNVYQILQGLLSGQLSPTILTANIR